MSKTVTVNIAPANEKQKLFLESIKRFILLSGSVSCGKTFLGCSKGHSLNHLYPGNRGLIVRKELSSLKTSTIITLLEKVLPPELIVKYDKVEGYILHKTMVPGVYSRIDFSGLDKKADQSYPTKIGSTEYGWIFGDEITEFTREDFQMLATRLRYNIKERDFVKVKAYLGWPCSYDSFCKNMIRQFFGATNPDSPEHHLYKFYFENINPDRELFTMLPQENPYNSPVYLKSISDTLTGIQRDRLWHGKWIAAEGVIYDCFTNDNIIDIDLVSSMTGYKYFFGGADSNFPKPRAGGIFGVTANGDIHLLDEYYQEGSHPEDLGQWFSDFATHFKIFIDVFHDPSDPEAIDKINAFSGVSCTKGKNAVIPGIDCVYRYFKNNVVKFNKKCVNSIRYTQNYQWKKGATQQPVKIDDHIPDAIRYALFTYNNQNIGGNDAPNVVFM